jgi:hypothetical protein
MFGHRMAIPALLALALAACDLAGEPVCRPGAGAYRLTSLSSTSDLELARQLAPRMAVEVANAAAHTCSIVAAGVAGPNPVSDLVLIPEPLTPKAEKAPNPTPVIQGLTGQASTYLEDNLLGPLARVEATPTSPLFGLMIALALQAEAHDEPPGCNVILGDAVAVEEIDGHRIDFRRLKATDEETAGLKIVVERLRPLAGGTVVLAGAGGHSSLTPARLLRARAVIATTLEAARIRVVWTRSPELPKACGSAQAASEKTFDQVLPPSVERRISGPEIDA